MTSSPEFLTLNVIVPDGAWADDTLHAVAFESTSMAPAPPPVGALDDAAGQQREGEQREGRGRGGDGGQAEHRASV